MYVASGDKSYALAAMMESTFPLVLEFEPERFNLLGPSDRRLAQAQRRAVARRHVLLAKFFALLRSRTTLPQPCPTFSQFSELSLRPRALVL